LSPRIAIAVGVLIVFAAVIAAANLITASKDEVRDPEPNTAASVNRAAGTQPPSGHTAQALPPASAGVQPGNGSEAPFKSGAEASWSAFEATVPAEIGVAVQVVGSESSPTTFGPRQSGHAWSSIKVPILVTLTNEREREGSELDAEEKSLARSALTASDNAAAASLFERLEQSDGGLEGASRAVTETLDGASATSTVVATAPPPPGAASRYGQTDWSLSAAAEFFAALDQGCVAGPRATVEVIELMGEVIPEQQWGLATASFPSDPAVAYKAGWGPEGSSSGPYLVRQSGIVAGEGGAVSVAMIAVDESGSFEGGVEDLDRISRWLAENLKSPLPSGSSGC
jgi:hypothetical protein